MKRPLIPNRLLIGGEDADHLMTVRRLGYDESIRRLRELGFLGADERPPMPNHVPQPEDEEPLGVSFFRTFVGEGADFSNLSIPRTYFGRSEISNASFLNTDLTESNLRWNDFIDVDFTAATLVRADLRASIYTRVNFTGTDLRGADLRRAGIEKCVFDGAVMDGAVLTRRQGSRLALSAVQHAAIDWRDGTVLNQVVAEADRGSILIFRSRLGTGAGPSQARP